MNIYRLFLRLRTAADHALIGHERENRKDAIGISVSMELLADDILEAYRSHPEAFALVLAEARKAEIAPHDARDIAEAGE